jgi:hypothetical protein
MNIKPPSPTSASLGSGLGQSSNFVQTELNPGVALDKTTKKYRLLLFENGVPKPRGSFFTDEDGMTAYSGYYDFIGRGPHGVMGVPLSSLNKGPPGAAILTLPPDKNEKNPAARCVCVCVWTFVCEIFPRVCFIECMCILTWV